MRYVLFTTNLAGGGAEKALAKIGEGLAACGHRIDFVVCEDAGAYPPPKGCRFHVLAPHAGHGWLGKRRLAWRLKSILHGTAYDLLVSTLPFADEVAALSKAPRHVCRIANTLSAEISRLPAAKGQRRLKRYRDLYASRDLVAVSQGVASDLVTCIMANGDRIRVIPNPFDFAHIRRLASEPCPERPQAPYLLHVGRYALQKRHDLLLAAFAQLASEGLSQRLVLMTAPDTDLERLIAAHGLEKLVTVSGFQANPYSWMAGADLLVLCSDHEGLPNVLIEALASGTRVVSTDCPSGPSEILRNEMAKWLVPCGDVEALVRTMRSALSTERPTDDTVEKVLAPYTAERAFNAWLDLARSVS